MTEKIKKQLEWLRSKEYKNLRAQKISPDFGDYYKIENQVGFMKILAENEKPIIYENDSFGFNRYGVYDFECRDGNIAPNYARVITDGFDKTIADIKKSIDSTDDEDKKSYGRVMVELVEICIYICNKYRDEAKRIGNQRLYKALDKIAHKGADTFYEALVFMKLCIFCLRLYDASHLTLGRFDVYMYPFYMKDKQNGVSDEEIFELIEEFFISINYDTDLYPGMQQGDNGQSIVLGGFDKDGNSMYNELSKMCMQASLELKIIDPKINLRVGKNTPDELYEYATLLTKQGLGFPQYCNDDIVVPGLVGLGYDYEDALDYVVAACWEFIIPAQGADIANIETMDFPGVVGRAIEKNLLKCDDFESLLTCVENAIADECNVLIERRLGKARADIPLLSVFVDGCIDSLTDMFKKGGKYMNYGCHGAGIANAADALAAVKKNIFDDKTITKKDLLKALKADFEGYSEIRNLLKASPKMGNNDDYVDSVAEFIMDVFTKNINGRDNGWGGIWRAGTGSAMEYLLKGERCPATADGRKSSEPYSSSFSPSLDVKTSGLLSVISSFTKYDMTKIINGGPLTIEIHDTVFRNDEGIKKVAMLVKSFIALGGHQLQLNAINRERLLDAQKHPEKYPGLITRVWGWSGYFNELDVKYQNHIIRRCEFGL